MGNKTYLFLFWCQLELTQSIYFCLVPRLGSISSGGTWGELPVVPFTRRSHSQNPFKERSQPVTVCREPLVYAIDPLDSGGGDASHSWVGLVTLYTWPLYLPHGLLGYPDAPAGSNTLGWRHIAAGMDTVIACIGWTNADSR
jgi:hypothetical protein